MNNLTMIAAVGRNRELGVDNNIIWHFKEDMKFFKDNTIGKPIVMGRKTLESLPHLLPKRQHIVLTTQEKELPDEVIVVHSINELINLLKEYKSEVMVIGGAQVYSELLDYSDKLLLTEIEANAKADVYFPEFNKDDWTSYQVGEDQEEKGIKYKHLVYKRKDL